MTGSTRPTIDDVAAAAGVSRGTVSRALNGERWVSEASQRAVEEAVHKTGYKANVFARGLKRQRSGTIAFLLASSIEGMFSDPNLPVILRAVSDALTDSGMTLVLLLCESANDRERAYEFIRSGQVDGVVLVSWRLDATLVGELRTLSTPVILCGTPGPLASEISYVAADDRLGARRAVGRLVELGRQRIAIITGPRDDTYTDERLRGYVDAIPGELDPALVAYGDFSAESGAERMRELLERVPDLDAVFAENDVMARAAIEVLMEAGRRVPEDVAIVGFDDSVAATSASPGITTMRQPFDRIAQELARLLRELIEGKPVAHVVVSTELVVRELGVARLPRSRLRPADRHDPADAAQTAETSLRLHPFTRVLGEVHHRGRA